ESGGLNKLLEKWKEQQENIACFLGLCLMAGFLWSRALLSISIALLFINALHTQQLKVNLLRWLADPFAKAGLLFFMFALVSACWSEDVPMWFASLKNKISFLVPPSAFVAAPLRSSQQRKWVLTGIVLMYLLSILSSLIH